MNRIVISEVLRKQMDRQSEKQVSADDRRAIELLTGFCAQTGYMLSIEYRGTTRVRLLFSHPDDPTGIEGLPRISITTMSIAAAYRLLQRLPELTP